MTALRPATVPVVHRAVYFLNVLRVVGGKAAEDEHPEHRDDPIDPARVQEDVDQARITQKLRLRQVLQLFALASSASQGCRFCGLAALQC